jgi:hypothetical protein
MPAKHTLLIAPATYSFGIQLLVVGQILALLLAHVVTKVTQGIKAYRERLGHKEKLGLLENKDHKGLLGKLAYRAIQGKLGHKEKLGLLGNKDHKDHKEIKGQLEKLVHKATLVHKEIKGPKAHKELKDLQVWVFLLVAPPGKY